ncbi:MAG: EpsG family protein [Salinivirgaceae bacterium]
MIYLFSIVTIFLGIIKKNSKFISLIILMFLWFIFGWNSGNIDYDKYERGYLWAEGALRFNSEVGYQILYKLFIALGFEYRHFLIFISFIGIFLISRIVKKFSLNTNLVYVLYFIFPFVIDVVQVRNFLSMALFLYSINYLVDNSKYSSLKYIIIVLFISSLHYSAIFYLSLLLVKYKDVKFLIIFAFLVLILGLFLVYTDFLYYTVLKFVPQYKVDHWFANKLNWGILVAAIIYLINLFIVYYSYYKIRYSINDEDSFFNSKILRFSEIAYKINILMLILFPLYIFNMIFFRLNRNIYIINYILFINNFALMQSKRNERLLFVFLVFLYVIILFFYFIFFPYRDSVFYPVFENNFLIEK